MAMSPAPVTGQSQRSIHPHQTAKTSPPVQASIRVEWDRAAATAAGTRAT